MNRKSIWEILVEKDIELPGVMTVKNSQQSEHETINTESSNPDVTEVESLGAPFLWKLASWAKETNSLQPWQRGIIGGTATKVQSNQSPSDKQAKQTLKALDDAKKLGFSYEELG